MCVSPQPPTSPPAYTHSEPVASHPVQETTTTTADSEKELLVCNVLTLYIVYEHNFFVCIYGSVHV